MTIPTRMPRPIVLAACLMSWWLPFEVHAQIDFGDDSGDWANDGECDDPRFEGDGMATFLVDADLYRDATDCRELFEQGRVRLAAAEAGERVETGRLQAGDDTLSSGEYIDTYTVEGAAGEELVIDLRSDDFDPYLIFLTPSGEQSDNDDYEGSTRRSVLMPTFEESGTYEVVVTSYEPGETGTYTLTLSSGTVADSGALDERGSLGSGDATLRDGEHLDQYEFEGRPGRRATVDLTSEDFDTYLIVVPPDGAQLENDDYDGTGHSRVEIDAAEPGTYRVVVTSYAPGETGSYRLRVEQTEADSPADRPTFATLELGQTADGRLEQGDASLSSGEYWDGYWFDGDAGQSIALSMTSSELDTYLAVTTPNGDVIENDDYESDTGRSRIQLTLTESGRYRIVATSYAAEETGSYALSIDLDGRAEPARRAGSRIFGVFAGISDYGGRASNLAYTAEDAVRIRDALISGAGMDAADAITLVDDAATKDNLVAAIDDLAPQIGPDDMFVLFYSGHGSRVPRAAGPTPTDPDALDETIELYDEALLDDELNGLLGRIDAGAALVILDSCFSGGFAKDIVSAPGRMGMFSSEEDVVSAVAAKFRAGGYLAHFIDEAIGQSLADEDQDARITALELSQYIHERYRVDVTAKGPADYVDLRHLGYQHLVVDRGGLEPFDVLFELSD